MKASELQIGDFVKVKPSGMIIKVAAVHQKKIGYHVVQNRLEWARFDLLEPIPLTAEILEKNGFVNDTDEPLNYVDISCGFFDISICYNCDYIEELTIRYVHQLQHALRLCGIKKGNNTLTT